LDLYVTIGGQAKKARSSPQHFVPSMFHNLLSQRARVVLHDYVDYWLCEMLGQHLAQAARTLHLRPQISLDVAMRRQCSYLGRMHAVAEPLANIRDVVRAVVVVKEAPLPIA